MQLFEEKINNKIERLYTQTWTIASFNSHLSFYYAISWVTMSSNISSQFLFWFSVYIHERNSRNLITPKTPKKQTPQNSNRHNRRPSNQPRPLLRDLALRHPNSPPANPSPPLLRLRLIPLAQRPPQETPKKQEEHHLRQPIIRSLAIFLTPRQQNEQTENSIPRRLPRRPLRIFPIRQGSQGSNRLPPQPTLEFRRLDSSGLR